MISARVSSKLESDAAKAARTVGLNISDLVRVGLQRVVDEIAAKRCLTLLPPSQAQLQSQANGKPRRSSTK